MKFFGLVALLGGIAIIVALGSQDGTDIAQVTNILVGQAGGAMLACLGGTMLAH